MRAIPRRTQSQAPQRGGPGRADFMDLVLQPGLQQARCDDQLLELTATEFGLLECLLRNPGRIVSRPAPSRCWARSSNPSIGPSTCT